MRARRKPEYCEYRAWCHGMPPAVPAATPRCQRGTTGQASSSRHPLGAVTHPYSRRAYRQGGLLGDPRERTSALGRFLRRQQSTNAPSRLMPQVTLPVTQYRHRIRRPGWRGLCPASCWCHQHLSLPTFLNPARTTSSQHVELPPPYASLGNHATHFQACRVCMHVCV